VKKLTSAPALFAAAGALLVLGLLLSFLYAPVDASSMGYSQKILFYHAPIAWVALLSYGIAFVAGVLYLRDPQPKWDRLGWVSVRLGLLFSLLVMITGMIWGKAAWGTWWAWEPRLTTFLIACFLYIAYFVLRQVVDEESRRATFAAVFAIVAFIDVPITFFATRYMPEGLHPAVITTSDTGMEGSMFLSLMISMVGMTLLLAALLRTDLAVARVRDEIDDLKTRIGGWHREHRRRRQVRRRGVRGDPRRRDRLLRVLRAPGHGPAEGRRPAQARGGEAGGDRLRRLSRTRPPDAAPER